jgi:hypothetical protein
MELDGQRCSANTAAAGQDQGRVEDCHAGKRQGEVRQKTHKYSKAGTASYMISPVNLVYWLLSPST